MRVGFYHESAGHRLAGGIGVFVRELALHLADTHEVVLYTRQTDAVPQLDSSAVDVVQVPLEIDSEGLRSRLIRRTPMTVQDEYKLLMLRKLLEDRFRGLDDEAVDLYSHLSESVDVLITSQWLDEVVLSNAVDTPTIFEFHGAKPIGLGSKALKWLSNPDCVLANSNDTATRVEMALGMVPDGILYPGVDTQRYNPSVTPAFEHDEPVVLFVGRVTAQKGIFDLVDAFESVADAARLHVVGRGDLAAVRTHARRLGIADAVSVEGVVPEEDLPHYYAACDVFCLPSHYEPFGMANLEAMATGKPVVTTNVGGIPEYATHGVNALLTAPRSPSKLRSHLERMLQSPTLRTEMGQSGREVAETFDWQHKAEELARCCERVVSETAPTLGRV